MNSILSFRPIFVHVIWGGDKIADFKGMPSQGNDVGESWELSPISGRESVVDCGPYAGSSLSALIAENGEDILGRRLLEKYNGSFPLLIKFIDSRHDLSIQVHPDDEMAQRVEGKNGKSELWYCIAQAPGASLYAGFNSPQSRQTLRRHIQDSTIVDTLNKYYTEPGLAFFIPAGCVHSIGSNNFVIEIQEASDVTYRIFDYNRLGRDGRPRELHIDKAAEAVKFYNNDDCRPRKTTPVPNDSTEVIHTPEFNTDLIEVRTQVTLPLRDRDSFTILITLSGLLTIVDSEGRETTVGQGRTLLVPASVPSVRIYGNGTLLSVYIP